MRDKIVAFMRAFIAEHGYSPTVREIAEAVGLSTSGTYHHLEALRTEGVITGGPGARTWRLAAA